VQANVGLQVNCGSGSHVLETLKMTLTITGQLGSAESTAAVEPRGFTTGLMRNSVVVDLVRGQSGAVRGVALASGEIVEGDAVVIAMGPWSILAAHWLPLPAVLGYKGHSLVKARQACFRPVSEDGLPFIGAVPGVDGAYVATGHSVWGMLNAPATGEAMSELILDGAARHVDLAPFAPGRLPPLDVARLRGLSANRASSDVV
jgi:glycine/D-amino acid oxidase-like deaminating enzyme